MSLKPDQKAVDAAMNAVVNANIPEQQIDPFGGLFGDLRRKPGETDEEYRDRVNSNPGITVAIPGNPIAALQRIMARAGAQPAQEPIESDETRFEQAKPAEKIEDGD